MEERGDIQGPAVSPAAVATSVAAEMNTGSEVESMEVEQKQPESGCSPTTVNLEYEEGTAELEGWFAETEEASTATKNGEQASAGQP